MEVDRFREQVERLLKCDKSGRKGQGEVRDSCDSQEKTGKRFFRAAESVTPPTFKLYFKKDKEKTAYCRAKHPTQKGEKKEL